MRSRRVVIAGLAAAATALSLAATAQAETPLRAVTHELDESRAEVLRHWTPARMRNADAAEMPALRRGAGIASRTAPDGRGTPQRRRTSPPLSARAAPIAKPRLPKRAKARASWFGVELPWLITSYGYTSANSAVGRLFYTKPDGQPSFCSATVVATNVILTAAHCVRADTSENGWENSSFVFVPGVYGSIDQSKRFTGRAVSYWSEWYDDDYKCAQGTGCDTNFSMDYAFITLNRNAAGRNVAELTGSYGLWPGAPKSSAYVLGYPGEGTWAQYANYPYHCRSTPQAYYQYIGGRYDVGLSCHNTGGASGGPWFQTASDGRSYISSVMSHMGTIHWQNSSCQQYGCPRFGNTFFGPYFNNDTTRLLAIARAK
jgi:V8-like Glu-specific endopeptidase